jgi:ADP-ribose pyrophosphatase
MEAGHLQKIGEFYLVPGYSTELMAAFLATELRENPLDADEDEFLDVEKIPLKKAFEMAERGEIQDGKTLAALLLARPHLGKRLA